MRRLFFVLILQFLFLHTIVYGQISFTVELQEDNVTYLVKFRSDKSYEEAGNTTNNAQVSFVVPTGGFKVGNIQNITGTWENNNNRIAPQENVGSDYLVFNLSSNISKSDVKYNEGEEIEFFSFQNIGNCTGTLAFVKEDDPFFLNSENLNIGNQITVFGAGQVNAYSGSYGPAANCQQSQGGGNNCITLDSITTRNPALCGEVGGIITLHATSENNASLRYSIDDGATFSPDPTFTDLESARTYPIVIKDNLGFCYEEFETVVLGPPTDAIIVSTHSTPDSCEQTNGTIRIEATPIIVNTILEYSIDEGQSWHANDGVFTDLAAGNYKPRVRAKDAPCHDEVDEIIVMQDCSNNTGGGDDCIYTYVLEANEGVFTVSLLSDTTIAPPLSTTVTAQITLKVPTGSFEVSELTNLIDGIVFSQNSTAKSPSEAPEYDYLSFGLDTRAKTDITYNKGVKVPLFSFKNGGSCTGGQVFLIENFTDPFYPPNSQDANVGQQLTVALTQVNLDILCVQSNSISDCGEELGGTPTLSTDTVYYTLPIQETTNICLGSELEITTANLGTVSLCNSGSTVMPSLTDGSNCFDITTDDHFNQTETICIVHFDKDDNSISDTTYLILCPEVDLGADLSICIGESIQLRPLGGTGSYNWITDGNISCTDCPNPEIQPDVATQYIVTSMDGNHCKDSDTLMVNVLDAANDLSVLALEPTNCEDNGSITISIGQGQGPFKYSINNGDTYQDNGEFENLGVGNYQIIVSSQDESCTTTWPQTVELTASGVPTITDVRSNGLNECKDEKGSIIVLSSINTDDTLEYSIDGGTTWQADTLFENLEAGTYNISVRIQNSNCETAFTNNPVELTGQKGIQVTSAPDDRTICNDANSSIELAISEDIDSVTVTGGDYENIIISGNTVTFKANPDFMGTVYLVTITGQSGCAVTDEFTLTQGGENTDDWDPQFDITPASCDDNDGSIRVTVNGNNDGFTFCWLPNKASGPMRDSLHSDSLYSLTITGTSGCDLVIEDLSVGTDCMPPPCNIFTGLDTLDAFVEGDQATVCLPITNMDLSEFQYLTNGQMASVQFGDCMKTSVFYDYGVLTGTAPYTLINWSVNGDTIKDVQFDTFEELVLQMNQFDGQANWFLNNDRSLIQGFSTDNNYGSLAISPTGSSQTPELELSTMTTMFPSLILPPTRGIQKYTVKDTLNDCEDEIYIRVKGLNDGMDTLELVTLVNTPINNECLNTDETGTENLEIKICNQPSAGAVNFSMTEDHCFNYIPNNDFVGKDFFCLELCNGDICDTTLVNVTVREEGIVFFTGFSPNNDNINDIFTIRNIENYPDNKLIIYNRWGNLIYQKEGYTNDTGWDGTFDRKNVPDGVYFYLMTVTIDNQAQVFSGPVTINR